MTISKEVKYALLFMGLMMSIGSQIRPAGELQDMTEVKGDFAYCWKERIGRSTTLTFLSLQEFSSAFQLIPDYNGKFNRDSFNEEVKKGDEITLEVGQQQKHLLNESQTIFVYGIRKDETVYLNSEEAISTLKKSNRFVFYLGMGVALIALYLIIIGRRKQQKVKLS